MIKGLIYLGIFRNMACCFKLMAQNWDKTFPLLKRHSPALVPSSDPPDAHFQMFGFEKGFETFWAEFPANAAHFPSAEGCL